MTKNIMIVGVGGQGTLLTSRLLGNMMLKKGYDVKVSEVHGMSQRGGSVVTYVRYGQNVASPIIEQGQADIILAFEQLEAARWLPCLKKGGCLVVNTQTIDPMPVITGAAQYPAGVLEALSGQVENLIATDALALALQAGSAKAVNVVLVGIMAQQLDISPEEWKQTIRESVPPKFCDMNLKAFELGYAFKK